ncbi:hypothetical protein PIB30_009715, partial [Stylosanthes scabra]|nr:hypothetical protein [Stylosanthes scabra]
AASPNCIGLDCHRLHPAVKTTVITVMAIGVVLWLDRGKTFLHGVHELEVDPRGVESRHKKEPWVLDLVAVVLPELLPLLAAFYSDYCAMTGRERRSTNARSGGEVDCDL